MPLYPHRWSWRDEPLEEAFSAALCVFSFTCGGLGTTSFRVELALARARPVFGCALVASCPILF